MGLRVPFALVPFGLNSPINYIRHKNTLFARKFGASLAAKTMVMTEPCHQCLGSVLQLFLCKRYGLSRFCCDVFPLTTQQ